MWDEEKDRQQKEATKRNAIPDIPIHVHVDGRAYDATAGVTTPQSLYQGKLASKKHVIALIDGKTPWDMSRPLERSCHLEYHNFKSEIGMETFWHSSAHILGQAIEQCFPDAHLTDGPALLGGSLGPGFFYDVWVPSRHGLTADDIARISNTAIALLREPHEFERLTVSVDFARSMFSRNTQKLALIDTIEQREKQSAASESEQGQDYDPDQPVMVTLYRNGAFIDLCRGPHAPRTSLIRAFECVSASALTLTDEEMKVVTGDGSMNRVYGISFPEPKLLRLWKKRRLEAEKRDHRKLGKDQQLFMFHPFSAGSAFFLPHGTRIYNKLTAFLRAEYRKRGYDEVRTPLLYDKQLWQTSGHWQNYQDDMFVVTGAKHFQHQDHHHDTTPPPPENATKVVHHAQAHPQLPADASASKPLAPQHLFGLKPMNCPGHCVLFADRIHSYRELPRRLADFSALHRNELSGALSGLTRLRRFTQDDAHIFCTPEQVQAEIIDCLEFIRYVYSNTFGFDFELRLSTRPSSFVGSIEQWDQAESALTSALDAFGHPWTLNHGDGAFYGPKIDIAVLDALERAHQCATVQLDFQLPQRFQLKYKTEQGTDETPVMIHRAVLGSIERMMAILLEHTAGKWPFWLSPRQCIVVPVSSSQLDYASAVHEQLHSAGYDVELDSSNETLSKKIRQGQLAQFNYILVVGDEEQQSRTVNVRTRDNQVHGTRSVDQLLEEWHILVDKKQ
jgi:threonyl-tRNA synthetase